MSCGARFSLSSTLVMSRTVRFGSRPSVVEAIFSLPSNSDLGREMWEGRDDDRRLVTQRPFLGLRGVGEGVLLVELKTHGFSRDP